MRVTSFIARAFFLLLLVSLLTTVGYTASFFDSLLLDLEREIGVSGYQRIISEQQVMELPAEDEKHLTEIFDRLVAVCGRQSELQFSLTVVEDETVNAFALPGGYIFVHTGLLDFVRSEGELAGVLAHELAHVDLKHGMKAVGRQIGFSLLFQLMLGDSSSEQIAKIGAVAINLTQLGYGREAEFEADRSGALFMARSGYSKAELISFLERLQEESGDGKNPAFIQIFSTHPPIAERIKRLAEL